MDMPSLLEISDAAFSIAKRLPPEDLFSFAMTCRRARNVVRAVRGGRGTLSRPGCSGVPTLSRAAWELSEVVLAGCDVDGFLRAIDTAACTAGDAVDVLEWSRERRSSLLPDQDRPPGVIAGLEEDRRRRSKVRLATLSGDIRTMAFVLGEGKDTGGGRGGDREMLAVCVATAAGMGSIGILEWACEGGWVDTCLISHLEGAVEGAAMHGRLHVLDWFLSRDIPDAEEAALVGGAYEMAAGYGRVPVLAWLLERFSRPPLNPRWLRAAVRSGSVETVEWLVRELDPPEEEEGGEEGGEEEGGWVDSFPDVLLCAAWRGDGAMVDHLRSAGFPWMTEGNLGDGGREELGAAVKGGHVDLVERLVHTHGVPWLERDVLWGRALELIRTRKGGSLPLLSRLLEISPSPPSWAFFEETARRYDGPFLEQILGVDGMAECAIPSALVAGAVRAAIRETHPGPMPTPLGRSEDFGFDTLLWLLERGHSWSDSGEEIVLAIEAGSYEVLEWLRSRTPPCPWPPVKTVRRVLDEHHRQDFRIRGWLSRKMGGG